jgi:hypothetical protein
LQQLFALVFNSQDTGGLTVPLTFADQIASNEFRGISPKILTGSNTRNFGATFSFKKKMF